MILLTDAEFENIVSYMKRKYGINLEKKRQLIEARMYAVLQNKGLDSYSDYFKLIENNDMIEVNNLINRLSTNHTYFLRESAHFDYYRNIILPNHEKNNTKKDIRIWSAGCSTGEEAYTTVMCTTEYFGAKSALWDYRILATDVSLRALNAAKNTVYTADSLKDIPSNWLKKYFVCKNDGYTLADEVKNQVIFKPQNLMEPFNLKEPFDLIFCRNVMIYFDQPTKTALVNKFYEALNPGGYLFISHSETIQRENTKFIYIEPSIYRKG